MLSRGREITGCVYPGRPASRTDRRPIQYLPHLHMPPLATVCRSGLGALSRPAMALRLVWPAALMSRMIKQHVGSELRRLRLRAARIRLSHSGVCQSLVRHFVVAN
jgi:hypothetical protein